MKDPYNLRFDPTIVKESRNDNISLFCLTKNLTKVNENIKFIKKTYNSTINCYFNMICSLPVLFTITASFVCLIYCLCDSLVIIFFACDGVDSAVIQILDWSEVVAHARTIILCFKLPELFELEHQK